MIFQTAEHEVQMSDSEWRIGRRGGIVKEDVIIIGVVHVSDGTLQARLALFLCLVALTNSTRDNRSSCNLLTEGPLLSRWSPNGSLPEQKRWRLSRRDAYKRNRADLPKIFF